MRGMHKQVTQAGGVRDGSNGLRWLGVGMATLLLAACSSGGSNRSAPPPPPPTPPPAAPPPPAPDPDPTPPVVEQPNPAYSAHLQWTGAGEAHADGLSGAGIRIGVIDSGVNRDHPALSGRVMDNLIYIDPNENDLTADDVMGHGTAVAQTIAGSAFGQWPGGIAPGAEILSARIISDEPPEDDGSGRGNAINGALGMAPIHQDLIQRGMRIMNNSWGGLYWDNPAATALIAAEYRPFIRDYDGLVVFSAGNSESADPSDTAALPSQPGRGNSHPAADLERGWLTVAALDANDPQQLAGYSNACGIAMYYCLAAPGTVVVTGTDDPPDAPEYWRWRGTSFAAPIVSGAAALVWEAFPYFDNDLVRQTLLGTATDLGEPGVDPVFGYGALDIARAVQGPAKLDWGDVVAAFDGGTSVWGNDLSGAGAIIKDGNGTLVLQGRADNLGGLFVDAGTVQALDTIAGDIDVAEQARLVLGDHQRGGDIGGTLDNAGRVEVLAYGNAISTTRIGGDYWHEDRAILALELGQRLEIAGSAFLDGGSFHLLGVKPGYTASAREQVLFANAGVTGQFRELTWANSLFLQGSLSYAANHVWLDITRLDVTAAAMAMADLTPMALSGAVRLEQAFSALDAAPAAASGHAAAFWRAAGQFQQLHDQATAVAALDSLSGQAHVQAISLAFDTIGLHRQAVAARLSSLSGSFAQPAAWKHTLGQGGSGGLIGAGWHHQGWLMGRDVQIGTGPTVAGLAFGESRADTARNPRERGRAHQTQGQFYLGHIWPRGYLAAQLGMGRIQRQIERHPFAGDQWQGVSSLSNGHYQSLGVETGRGFTLGAARLTPHLGIELDRLSNAAFEEWGAAGFGLRTAAARLQRTQMVAGLRAEGRWQGLHLSAHAHWQQVLAADGFEVMASFTGIDRWSPLPLAAAARSGGMLGLGMQARLSPNGQLHASLDQRFGPRGHERMAMLRYVHGF